MKWFNKTACIFFTWFVLNAGVCDSAHFITVLERSNYTKLASSFEISSFLSLLSYKFPTAEKVTIAESVRGNAVEALLISSDLNRFREGDLDDNKLTVMLVGSQHGNETSGAEVLMLVARDLLEGRLRIYLNDMNFIVIPNTNPDGRYLKRRRNANKVDINRNYMALTEPEAKGIIDAIHRWDPEVVLDVHEAAALKKKTLAKEGYLTNFEAQFDAANNPNVDKRILNYSFKHLLPQILEEVNSHGLFAQRYVRSVKSIHQPITHGRLSLSTLRNMAGMLGAFSFLLENRLDPPIGTYQTPRNLRVRVSKQYLCITTFLNLCRTHRVEIMAISLQARMKWKNPGHKDPLYLSFGYAAKADKPFISLPLLRIDTGAPIMHTFSYHGAVAPEIPLNPPTSYIITSHQDIIKGILARHHVKYRKAQKNDNMVVSIKRVKSRVVKKTGTGQQNAIYAFKERTEDYQLRSGDMVVGLNQPARRLLPMLLELQSVGSIFNTDDYLHLVEEQKDFFILPSDE